MSSPLRNSAVLIVPCQVQALRSEIAAGQSGYYAILDACDEPRVPKFVAKQRRRAASLYAGDAAEDFWDLAPYIAAIDEYGFDWIVDNLWSDPWGFLFTSDASLDECRKHFRHYLEVEGEGGETVLFRFYDPRVLPVFLEQSTPPDGQKFFGPVIAFYITKPNGELFRITPVAAGK